MVSRDGGILTDDVEESYGEETSVTETDDDLNDRKQDFFEGESADGAEDEFSETDREYEQRWILKLTCQIELWKLSMFHIKSYQIWMHP